MKDLQSRINEKANNRMREDWNAFASKFDELNSGSHIQIKAGLQVPAYVILDSLKTHFYENKRESYEERATSEFMAFIEDAQAYLEV